MRSSFKWPSVTTRGPRGARFWLQIAVGALALLNAIALFLYLDPPGGSRAELTAESQQLRSAITAARMQNTRLKTVAGKVELGSQQSVNFEALYFLPKRLAYELVITEIQRMAQAANLSERDGIWTEEPIEGTADLSILTSTTNFDGSYSSLMRFLHEVDRSPMLLMLDTLTATPQKAGDITAQVRFQSVIREDGNTTGLSPPVDRSGEGSPSSAPTGGQF